MSVGACFPKLMMEFVVKNDGIPHGLRIFSYKIFVGKDVSDIVYNICAPIDEFDLVFDEEILKLFHLNLLLLLLQMCMGDNDMMILKKG